MSDLEEVLKNLTVQLNSRFSVPATEVESVKKMLQRLKSMKLENLQTNTQVGVSVSVGSRAHLWLRFCWDGIDLQDEEDITHLAELFRHCSGEIRSQELKFIATHLEGAGPKEAGFDSLSALLQKEAREEGYIFCGSFSIN